MKCSDSDKMNKAKRSIVALSGGVDSSVAASLAKDMGYTCEGVMLKLHRDFSEDNSGCGTLSDMDDAKKVADMLNIPFSLLSCEDSFDKNVIERFIASYESGCTPNPCVECNRYLKFGKLFEYADKNDIEYIITGHYARTEFDVKYGRVVLKKAIDETKDQSYVLYSLPAEKIARIILPLGEYQKSEVRDMARTLEFENAHKKDSQDICFIPDGDYISFIEKYRNKIFERGYFVDKNDKILGEHRGIIRYTIGQHKKLGLVTDVPLYVSEIDHLKNKIVLVQEQDLFKTEVKVGEIVWSAFDKPPAEFRATAKLRYRHKAASCTVKVASEEVTLVFDEGQRAPSRGQSAVIYDGDILLGGGIIK